MGHLSTHVLDTMHGSPAAGMRVRLLRLQGADANTRSLRSSSTPMAAMPAARCSTPRRWRPAATAWCSAVAAYFRARGVVLPEPPFIDEVQLDFGIADAAGHYHVPLLVSPWSYSTYRGS